MKSRPRFWRRLWPVLLCFAAAGPVLALGLVKVRELDPAPGGNRLLAPADMVRDQRRDTLVVSDTEGGHVFLLDFHGNARTVLGKEGRLQLPTALAVSREGTLYIAERNREVLKVLEDYDSPEKEVYQDLDLSPYRWSKPVEPAALYVDPGGNLLVADKGNRQVLVLGPGPEPELKLRILKVGAPVDLWADDGRILVADARSGAIRVYDRTGRLQRTLGDAPSRRPVPLRPAAFTVDRRERIWVVEPTGGLRVLDLLGNERFRMPDGTFLDPSSIESDPRGAILVLERGGNRILEYERSEF